MKCNYCKKIIPQGEEIIIDKEKEKKHYNRKRRPETFLSEVDLGWQHLCY
jgi:hypothetical protein